MFWVKKSFVVVKVESFLYWRLQESFQTNFSESKAYSKLYDCELNFHVSDGNWTWPHMSIALCYLWRSYKTGTHDSHALSNDNCNASAFNKPCKGTAWPRNRVTFLVWVSVISQEALKKLSVQVRDIANRMLSNWFEPKIRTIAN